MSHADHAPHCTCAECAMNVRMTDAPPRGPAAPEPRRESLEFDERALEEALARQEDIRQAELERITTAELDELARDK